MSPFYLRSYKAIARTLFCFVLLIGLLPLTLLAQFCPDGTTILSNVAGQPDQFMSPLYTVIDAEGNIYVSDTYFHRVLKFAPGSNEGVIFAGGNGGGDALNQLDQPHDIILDANGNLLIADWGNSRIMRYPPNSTSATFGTIAAGTGEPGDAPNQLSSFPTVLTLDDEGNLFVGSDFRVQKFPPNSTSATAGTIVAGGNGEGNALNQFKRTMGIDVDAEGNLYVSDFVDKRILKFPPNSTSATLGTIVAKTGVSNPFDPVGIPGDIIVDETGTLYVSEPYSNKLTMFPPNSTSLTVGTTITGTNDLYSIYFGLFIDTDGYLYAVDVYNSRVRRFSPGTPTPTPVLSLSPSIPQPILQNTPFVTLAVSGCSGGTVTWQGPNSNSGSGTTISVPTSATGTLVYSATCTIAGGCPGSPGSTTVTISPSDVTGSFDGFIYGADCSTFRGWAWDRTRPNTVFSVDIFDGPKFLESIPANEFRQDLKDAGKGNGIHAFRWSIPESMKDGQVHYLSARVAGSSFYLKDSPKALICQGGTVPPPTNKPPVPPSVTPLTAQQGVAFTTTLPAFTDPEGSTLSYGLVSLPNGLTFTSTTRIISGTALQSGAFTLAYSATDDKGATNSVSFPLTVNSAATTPVTGSFEGYLDKVECSTIRGWVWDRNKPNTPVSVEIYSKTGGGDETVWGSTVANIYRDDLKNAGKGNGAHAYSFTVPNELKNGTNRVMYGRVLGSTYTLKDSGKPLTCNAPVRLSAENSEGLRVTVLGNPVFDQLEVEVRGAEGQSLRLQLTDASGRLISQRQIEVAKPVEQQTLSVSQQPAGLFLLRVNNGLKSLTLKVLKQ